jgi:putative membrane protein insertion efficiency factor
MATVRKLALLAIRFYQCAVSPHFPPSCRYAPTCSVYAYEAVEKYGVCRGVFLALKRILRCHPFHQGGYDPVP